MELQERVGPFGKEALVAQRLKRLSSIGAKLGRFRNMNLARMQDVGGCRAVLPSVDDVRRVTRGYADSPPRHRVVHTDDYLTRPRASGYRGIHLVSRFQSGEAREAVHAGMRIEIQLRSRLQHAWAAAVETVGTFSGQALKSSEGDEGWLRFFALMASEIAFSEECPVVPDTADSRDVLRRELAAATRMLDAVARLERYRQTHRRTADPPGTACLRARASQVDEARTAGRGARRGGTARPPGACSMGRYPTRHHQPQRLHRAPDPPTGNGIPGTPP